MLMLAIRSSTADANLQLGHAATARAATAHAVRGIRRGMMTMNERFS
jgi:hypothetical protein